MNYGTLNRLNDVLANLQKDIMTVGFTIAGLMVVIYAILIMFDHNSGGKALSDRWGELRKVLLCAAIIAAASALIGLSHLLGGSLLP